MKISGPSETAPASTPRAPEERGQRAEPGERAGDRVSVAEAERLERVAQVLRESATQQRSARLAQIEAAVRNGTYRPDARRIAEELLRSAEVSARVQALLR